MKNLVKLAVFLLVFFIIFATKSIAADLILPLPKPDVDKETKAITAKKKEIYPQKKPESKKSEVQIDTSKKIDENIEKKDEVFIYPEKKPIVVKTKIDKAVTKSTVLSKKDYKIAKNTFAAIDKKNGKQL